MRAGPAIQSSFLILSASSVLGMGCLLNSSAYDSAGAGGVTTTSSTSSSTSSMGGTTTTTTGGGGSAGGTGGSVGGTGGTGGTTGGGGTGGMPTPTSCKEAMKQGATESGVVTISPPGAVAGETLDVYCDQKNMGGGWALVLSSVADPAGGTTTAFWNILYANRLDVIAPSGPTPSKNYYAGKIYTYGTEFRDDIEDPMGVVAIGVVHATASGINPSTMKITQPNPAADNISQEIYAAHFAGGWSSPDHEGDAEPSYNCAVYWGNVTQHYDSNTTWRYNLGTDRDPQNPGAVPPDFTDGGWGPHVLDTAIDQINTVLAGNSKPTLSKDGAAQSLASRMKRISRFARW